MSYGQLNAVLVKAVQEQQKEIDELKAKNERLEAVNKSLDSRLSALEQKR